MTGVERYVAFHVSESELASVRLKCTWSWILWQGMKTWLVNVVNFLSQILSLCIFRTTKMSNEYKLWNNWSATQGFISGNNHYRASFIKHRQRQVKKGRKLLNTNKCTIICCVYSKIRIKTLKKLLHVSIHRSSSGGTRSSLLKLYVKMTSKTLRYFNRGCGSISCVLCTLLLVQGGRATYMRHTICSHITCWNNGVFYWSF
jgi:hypothetical protein